jgi:tRNA threonylcarbamoyladenosine biosynthesis protein TsaE
MQKSTTKSFEETQKLGEDFAKEILAAGLQANAVVLGLQGDLGAGKTTFLQGFSRGLGISEVVNSPTFVIMKRFELKNGAFKNFYHIDCYRLNSVEEIESLGFEEIIKSPENIVAVEWPERIESILPKQVTSISFDHKEENIREIEIRKN